MFVVDYYYSEYSFVLVLSNSYELDGDIETVEFASEEDARDCGYDF